jgi:hypothetical protein
MDRRVLTILLVLLSLAAILIVVQLYDRTSATDSYVSPTANQTIVKNATGVSANLTPNVTTPGESSSMTDLKGNNSTVISNMTEQSSQAMPQAGQGGTPPEGFNGVPPSGGTPPGGAPPDGSGGMPGGTPPDGVSPIPSSTATDSAMTPTSGTVSNPSTAQTGLNGGTTTTSTSTDFASWMPTVKPINMSKFLNMSAW